jgi:hypothetical protein
VTDRRAPERTTQRLSSSTPLRCAECGRLADDAAGWRGYRIELEEDGGGPELAFFCPTCARDVLA